MQPVNTSANYTGNVTTPSGASVQRLLYGVSQKLLGVAFINGQVRDHCLEAGATAAAVHCCACRLPPALRSTFSASGWLSTLTKQPRRHTAVCARLPKGQQQWSACDARHVRLLWLAAGLLPCHHSVQPARPVSGRQPDGTQHHSAPLSLHPACAVLSSGAKVASVCHGHTCAASTSSSLRKPADGYGPSCSAAKCLYRQHGGLHNRADPKLHH